MKKISLLFLILIVTLQFKGQQLNLQFAKQFGGVSGYGESRSIALDALGNIYTTGFFTGTMDFDPGVGYYTMTAGTFGDIFVSKLDPSGNFLWAKQMVTTVPVFYNNVGNSIDVDALGNVYTTGSFISVVDFDPGVNTFTIAAGTNYNTFISKLDVNGNFVWAKNFGGASGHCFSNAIKLDVNKSVTTIGRYNNGNDFDPGAGTYTLSGSGVFIGKLDSLGNFVSAKKYIDSFSSAEGTSLAFDSVGNMYTIGRFQGTMDFNPGPGSYTLSPKNAQDIFISKHNAAGNFLWASQMKASYFGYSSLVKVDAIGNIYITGYFNDTLDCDPSINTYNLISNGNLNSFVSKLNTNGSFIWAKSFSGNPLNTLPGLAIDQPGNVYTVGSFRGTVDFDPGIGSYNLTSLGNYDAYISKLDQAGNFVWAIQMGDTSIDACRSIVVDGAGDIHTTGNFAYNVDFDPSSATYILNSLCVNNSSTYSYGDIYVQRICQGMCQTGIVEFADNEDKLIAYPNPADDKLNISFNSETNIVINQVLIYNSIGQLIREEELKNNSINIKDLPNGVYLLSLRQAQADKSGSVSKRFVVAR